MTDAVARHWESVWRSKRPDEVSWYQATAVDVAVVARLATSSGSVIDVGGGASCFAAELLGVGVSEVAVLDIAPAALEHARRLLGVHGDDIEWIVADITRWTPTRTWTVWHDRAVLHFLHDDDDLERYRNTAAAAVDPSGYLVISTFAPDGPEQCSGLDVRRWSVDQLSEWLAPIAVTVESFSHIHVTPWQSEQSFVTVVARRLGTRPSA